MSWIVKIESSSRRRFTLGFVAWMLAVQLPLPLVHAHSDSSESNALLQQHVERHHHEHPSTCHHEFGSTEDLHWHWVMPWEFTDVDNQSPRETPIDSTTAVWLINDQVVGACLAADLQRLVENGLVHYGVLCKGSLKRAEHRGLQTGSRIQGHWLTVLRASGHSLQSLVGIAHC